MTPIDQIRQAAADNFGNHSLLFWLKKGDDFEMVVDAYVEECRQICIEADIDPDKEGERMMKEAAHEIVREAWMRDSTGLYRFQMK